MELYEISRLLTTKLDESGLREHVVKEQSHVLGFPEEYFAETVLDDAGKIERAERAIAELAAQLAQQNQKLDYIVRALWQVKEVSLAPGHTAEAIPALMGQGIFSLQFVAILRSGGQDQKVGVELTPDAYQELRALGQSTDVNSLNGVVRDFLKLQLSLGGESYWDPVKYPRQRINDGAVLHLHYHPVPAA